MRQYHPIGRSGWPLVGALVTSVSLVAGCARSSSSQGGAHSDKAAASIADVGAAVALDPRTFGWEAGRRYRYGIQSSTDVVFGDGTNAFAFDLGGHADVVVTAVTADTATLYVMLGDAQIVSRMAASQPQLDDVADRIRRTGAFFVLSGGRVTEMRVEHGLSAMVANTYRAFGAALQFARAVGDPDRYSFDEHDTTGHYVAQYERGPATHEWRKHKERYLSLLMPKTASPSAAGQVVPEILASRGTVRLSADGRPEAVETYDEIDIKGAQQQVHSKNTVSLRAEAPAPPPVPAPDYEALFAAMDRIDATEPFGTSAPTEAFDQARIKGRTYATVLTRLEAIARDEGGNPALDKSLDADEQARRERLASEQQDLFAALAAILRQEEPAVVSAEKSVRAGSPVSGVLIDALGSASTPASERALVELMQSTTLNPSLRKRAGSSLVRAPRPDPVAIDGLKVVLAKDPFNPKALFGIGTYARRLRDAGNPGAAKELGELLLARLKLAGGPSSLVTVLRAIANSGYAPALAQVTPYLDDPRDGVRGAAVRALQSMQDTKADELIASRLESDPSNDVRISAIEAAHVREPNDLLAHALASSATDATDPHVRYRAVELMAQWFPLRSDFRPTLERVAASDAEERIRERAKAAL